MYADIIFANPGFLYLLILLPLMGGWYWYKLLNNDPGLQLSSTSGFSATKRSWRQYLIHALFAFRILAIGLLILAPGTPAIHITVKGCVHRGDRHSDGHGRFEQHAGTGP